MATTHTVCVCLHCTAWRLGRVKHFDVNSSTWYHGSMVIVHAYDTNQPIQSCTDIQFAETLTPNSTKFVRHLFSFVRWWCFTLTGKGNAQLLLWSDANSSSSKIAPWRRRSHYTHCSRWGRTERQNFFAFSDKRGSYFLRKFYLTERHPQNKPATRTKREASGP